jgi:hypothetical protein
MARKQSSRPAAPEVCPVCGEEVPRNALACRACGADHNSGWRDDAATYDGVDLGEEQFDYEQFVSEEFGTPPKKPALNPLWMITAALLLSAMLLFVLLR